MSSTDPRPFDELRESGLTWEQLGRLLGVSRRAVHNWANGGKIAARHIDLLTALAQQVRSLPAATPASRRALFLAPGADGSSMFEEFRLRSIRRGPAINGSPLTADQLLGALHEGD